jgi:hypothetical protein
MSDIQYPYEDWRDCPVIYRRGQQPPSVVIGEIVPKPPPTLDTTALLSLGYRETGKNELVRVGMTKARRPLITVDLWYLDKSGKEQHVCGFGKTGREAYRDAWQLRRQVVRFGSRVAAAEYARERINAQGIHEDVEDEAMLHKFELAMAG